MKDINKKRIYYSAAIPLFVLLFIWFIYLLQWGFNLSFTHYGIYPREANGWKGIYFSFFIHADLRHIFANSSAIFILLWILYYFFKDIANIVFPLCLVVSGLVTFIIGRPAYHIGASGTIYALFFFLIVSSLYRKNRKLTAISLMTVFIYGGLVWNMTPITQIIDPSISWEGHLSGAITGTILAFLFRKKGPGNDPEIIDEDDDSDDTNDAGPIKDNSEEIKENFKETDSNSKEIKDKSDENKG
ncbi:MAG: rhomboid family intramembrane serine protease [Bacteroidales bacterium]|nr:rhomboid family intramembrane serine protease [Bacteroidales bacterium]